MPSTHTETAVDANRGSELAHPNAFLTASRSVDTRVVREALLDRGYTPFRLDEFAPRGRSIPELLRDYVADADLVVAIIGDDDQTKNVFYELGFAQAWGRRILALSPSDLVPDTHGITCLRIDPANREAIEFGLDMILAAPTKNPRRQSGPSRPSSAPIGDLADELIGQLRGGEREGDLASVVIRAIDASGVEALSADPSNGCDIAVWSDDLEPWIRNPLLIEIKGSLAGEDSLRRAVDQVLGSLRKSSADYGLLIGTEFEPRSSPGVSIPPNVLVVSIEHFLESLRASGFGDAVRRLRNDRVHGRN